MPPLSEPQNRDRQEAVPATYLITWACYGSWLPGPPGAIPRTQNQFGTRLPTPDSGKELRARMRMTQPPYLLDARGRLGSDSLRRARTGQGYGRIGIAQRLLTRAVQ